MEKPVFRIAAKVETQRDRRRQRHQLGRFGRPGPIVTELAITALRHAFPECSSPGKIMVEYWSRPTGWRLSVQDNGVGMPGDHAARRPGLGTGIVDALAKQLDAPVSISDTNPGQGRHSPLLKRTSACGAGASHA
jgi:hypothetical protein